MNGNIDTRKLWEIKQSHAVTPKDFKYQGRHRLIATMKEMRECYLLAGKPKKILPILILAIPHDGTDYVLLWDEGHGITERLLEMDADTLLPFADVSAHIIAQNMERYGIQTDKADTPQPTSKGGRRDGSGRPLSYTPEQEEKVRAMRKAGQSLRNIAETTGVSIGTVRRILVK